MSKSRRWSDLSPTTKVIVGVIAATELVLQGLAWRDLRGRSADELRGPKWLWRLVLPVQPVGPIVYLAAGRRPTR